MTTTELDPKTRLIEAVWQAIIREPRLGQPRVAARLIAEISRSGWAYTPDLEDILYAQDPRLYGIDIDLLKIYLDLPNQVAYRRPRFLNAQCAGLQAITAFDVTAILIFLEQLGFATDPSTLVDTLSPHLEGKQLLTSSELDVLRYPKQQHRCLVELRPGGRRVIAPPLDTRRIRTETGYRIEMTTSAGAPYHLVAKGPKYRKRREPVSYRCPYCGMEYCRGDPEENAAHLSYHAQVKRVLDPAPKAEFVRALAIETDPELVRSSSPVWKHREMYTRARQFKREMRFDFVQWGCNAKGKDDDATVHGFLFNDDTGTLERGAIVGACAFRRREAGWGLQWAWICQKMRRKGILAKRWPRFLERFGDFEVEKPLSDAMKAFVARHGTDVQKRLHGIESAGGQPVDGVFYLHCA